MQAQNRLPTEVKWHGPDRPRRHRLAERERLARCATRTSIMFSSPNPNLAGVHREALSQALVGALWCYLPGALGGLLARKMDRLSEPAAEREAQVSITAETVPPVRLELDYYYRVSLKPVPEQLSPETPIPAARSIFPPKPQPSAKRSKSIWQKLFRRTPR